MTPESQISTYWSHWSLVWYNIVDNSCTSLTLWAMSFCDLLLLLHQPHLGPTLSELETLHLFQWRSMKRDHDHSSSYRKTFNWRLAYSFQSKVHDHHGGECGSSHIAGTEDESCILLLLLLLFYFFNSLILFFTVQSSSPSRSAPWTLPSHTSPISLQEDGPTSPPTPHQILPLPGASSPLTIMWNLCHWGQARSSSLVYVLDASYQLIYTVLLLS